MAQYIESGQNPSFLSDDAITDEGFVLKIEPATGHVSLCDTAEAAFGVSYKSTKELVAGVLTAVALREVAVVQKGRYAYVQYAIPSSGESIAIGDLVSVKGTTVPGAVIRHVSTAWPGTYAAATAETIEDEDIQIVGIAMEAVTKPGAGTLTGKMKVLLLCPLPIKQT